VQRANGELTLIGSAALDDSLSRELGIVAPGMRATWLGGGRCFLATVEASSRDAHARSSRTGAALRLLPDEAPHSAA
jgi:hypothetical protein